ncbi:glucoamylase family protein [uncultured Boseongicola sp.]|uniref:GH36-type glycosyl hydrolase domain-containing protein n=1 Tax=uncultured Boseongicola sp. TaxID=1648499 RepID=UPI002609E8F0|nr:glucoamylase family protein [uncultured Boseongicola sp.]
MTSLVETAGRPVDEDAAGRLAELHQVGEGEPCELVCYRSLSAFPDWLNCLRAYCQKPPPDQLRAADWLLDNDYQVARAIRLVQKDLPADFYRKLPGLTAPKGENIPRIFALAKALIPAFRPQISLNDLIEFVTAYQSSAPLTNAELWALPSMLRLASLEDLVSAFHQLSADLSPPFEPLEAAGDDTVAEATDRIELAISNLIAAQSIKWADFVDQVSPIEAILSDDPAAAYAGMTFETRNRYRRTVERMALRSRMSEVEIARNVVELSSKQDANPVEAHVGYWLIAGGLRKLEAVTGYRHTPAELIQRPFIGRTGAFYATGLILCFLAALVLPLAYLGKHDPGFWQWVAGVSMTALPASIISVAVVHWCITKLATPISLPELDYSDGIPTHCATAVAVPVIVKEAEEVSRVLEKLEIRWFANPDPSLHYVILSDFADADQEVLPGDAPIEAALHAGVDRLNRRHGVMAKGPFFLLHRPRRFNPSEGCWMGWERKRGKLEEFNSFIVDGISDGFSVTVGDVQRLVGLRYAIVLDADTELPPTAAERLVGLIAHPLNRARFDENTGRVVAGYTILQPRIEILPQLGGGTHFSYLYGGDTAIDIYSRAVSDVYQDLFETGIFVGKGIYDVAAMQRVMQGRVPANSILSHDLFEGLHGRAGLASNVVVYEDVPTSYPEHAMRIHRWMRGDWQLVQWLGRRVPSGDGTRVPNPLGLLDRWKIADNLRRSLLPPALLAFLIGGWAILPGSALVWTLLALAAPGAYLIGEVIGVASGGVHRGFIRKTGHRFRAQGGRWFLSLAFVISDTLVAIDAIASTLYRLFFSKRHLLEWTSAAHAVASLSHRNIRWTTWHRMWPSTALAVVIAGDLALYDFASLLPATPILALWLIAPEIAIWTAKPRRFRGETPSEADRRYLAQLARRTWHFFETFVGPEDNWLPPDNYQEVPERKVAHRTSPTNIGLLLVSTLSARELGFIATSELVMRAQNTLETLDRLKSHRGHILNWYDTRSLMPLNPQYVSTVDSGNLAMSLIALKQGCLELADLPAFDSRNFDGLIISLELLDQAVRHLPNHDTQAFADAKAAFLRQVETSRTNPSDWPVLISGLTSTHWQLLEEIIQDSIKISVDVLPKSLHDVNVWMERVRHHLHTLERDLAYHLPWLGPLNAAAANDAAFAEQVGRILSPLATSDGRQTNGTELLAEIDNRLAQGGSSAAWLADLRDAIERGEAAHAQLRTDLKSVADHADRLAYGMDFSFLYNPKVRLFQIGYNLSAGQMDTSHYDLLATEARLASLFAIAKGDAPMEHWFSFSRPITQFSGKPSILSWNGSMFEYLMPPLFLPSHRDTLLGESELTAVEVQRTYAAERGIPWGISESAFGVTDGADNYQYRAFGVPGLGIRRGLTEDLVVAPYATALALCSWPGSATQNLRELESLGALTCYGFIEALDFTPSRVSETRPFVAVRAFMAHHQGMTMAAITNVLSDDCLVRWTLREKPISAVDLLLQERVPWDAPLEAGRADETWETEPAASGPPALAPWIPSPEAAVPQMHFLGNGQMSVGISSAGCGGLSWRKIALTRWRPDPTSDSYGTWLYAQDFDRKRLWSVGRLPAGARCHETKTVFHQHMVEMLQRYEDIAIRMELVIAPFDDVEIRRVTVINESNTERTVDLTSYAEIVLAPPQEDERHPAFSKLFVGSDYVVGEDALIFERRPRRPETVPPVLLHKLVADDPDISVVGHETDRARFIGTTGSLASPMGLREELSGTIGWTLDPIMALQARVSLAPMETKQFAFLTITGTSRGQVLATARRFPQSSLDRAFRDAMLEVRRTVHRLKIEPPHLPELQVLSSFLAQPGHTLRSVVRQTGEGWQGQAGLWRFGISGDLPILLVKLDSADEPDLLDILIRAQRLWHSVGLETDLVVLRSAVSSYEEPLREYVLSVLRDSHSEGFLGRRGGIHLLASDQIDIATQRGLEAAAHIVLTGDHESLADIVDGALDARAPLPRFEPSAHAAFTSAPQAARPEGLLFDNGLGGFNEVTREYVMHLAPGQHTPSPWCNVLANDHFGTIVSEAGLGFTWALNSGEHRLTPWSNDPVFNEPGEVLYLRDEALAEVWTTTPAPMGQDAECQVSHGMGYSRFHQTSRDLEQEMLVFVPVDAPVKLVRLRLTNLSPTARRLTATYYAEWLIGATASVAKPHVTSLYDPRQKAILAQNHWNPEFGRRVAFLSASAEPHSVSGDRRDFLGQDGDVSSPDALHRWDLGDRFTPGGDACGAYQVHLVLEPGASEDVVFILGEGGDQAEAESLIARWRNPSEITGALRDLRAFWDTKLGALQVKTPDLALNLMVNQWLPYQNLSSRMMARAGFYQAGGAFGFRDQLQDMLGVLHSDPKRVRSHILRAARHQFEEGDVLHWWHPPGGQGVRTRCSDDYLWLPYVVARYVEATDGANILSEDVPFLAAPELRPDEGDRYERFDLGETASLLEHCARAIDRGLRTGAHGLPLIGSGDWNDGMDRIGAGGKGESVWLAWFQIATIRAFAPLAEAAGETDRVERWKGHIQKLRTALDEHAWDGAWYIRALDDDGVSWGSHTNDECQIDLIAQCWSVLCGDPPDERSRQALKSACERLLDSDQRLIRLLTPPFQNSNRDPGYIQAYPAGIRENGGQYTHAAAWLGVAMAEIGDGDRAWQVFDIINPIRRSETQEAAEHYRREPYVLTGDVSGKDEWTGVGGWSWYTGAAGWTWQLATRGILGVRLKTKGVHLDPSLPKKWGGAEVALDGDRGRMTITIEDPEHVGTGVVAVTVDGAPFGSQLVPFPDAGQSRHVVVLLGTAGTADAEASGSQG